MTNLPVRIARRVAHRLPETWKARLRSARVERSYTLNTRGGAVNQATMAWFAKNGRPVSIVIPSYNDIPLLTVALASIKETCEGVDYEVIVVDDFVDPGVQEQLQALEDDRVRVILKADRLGFAGTVNVGIAAARHDVVLLNSDIVAKPGWLQALQFSAYAIDSKIGMVSPKLVYPDGRIQYGGTYYARLLAPQWFGHLHVGSSANKNTANVAGYNTSVSGACVYVTRDALAKVGLLDDGFWLGFEDVDYGLRAWALGVRCFYQPAAMLVHHESASRGYSQGPRELASMRRFWRRWESRFLARKLPDDAPVTFALAANAPRLWSRYVDSLAEELRTGGRSVEVHRLESSGVDESLVSAMASRSGVVVACDWMSAETVWLAAAEGAALPVYLLPSVESIGFPEDPATQAAIVARYRSEFDYIAPNRWTANQLQAESAWDSRRRVPPAVSPEQMPDSHALCVVTIAASALDIDAVDSVCERHGYSAVHLGVIDDVENVAGRRPRAVVDFAEQQSSLLPFALMSVGAVYLAPVDGRLSHDVLDGYNALLFERDNQDQLSRSLSDALSIDEVWSELRANGHASVARAAENARRTVRDALLDFSQSPV